MNPRWQYGLRIPAADGTPLATDVYLPAQREPRPTILVRTYLGKTQHAAEATGWAQQGFPCVVQDVRGRYGSGGEWRPYSTEREDGEATVEWLLSQCWCDGRVVAVGGSYGAFTAWSAAVSHPAVKAVISAVPAMRSIPLQPEDGGVLPLLSRVSWWLSHAGARRPRADIVDKLLGDAYQLLQHLPLTTLPQRLEVDFPGWDEVLQATESVDLDGPLADRELAALPTPALHIGGWHDPFCGETLRHLVLVGSDHPTLPPQGLVLGPWWHRLGTHKPARYGERNYGEASRFPLGRFQADWLRQVLKAKPTVEAQIRVFLCGENRWLSHRGWPSRSAQNTTFYAAENRLDGVPPRQSGRSTFLHDPEDPRPCRRTPLDERDLEGRSDAAIFTSEPLQEPQTILGTPRVVLWASTDAPDTDWVARLLEVTHQGRRLYLAHGLVEAPRAVAKTGERFRPGKVQRVEIQLSPLGVTVPAKHRLRLEIASSAFPSYARNLGSEESRLTGSRMCSARQAVHWGPGCSTILELPKHLSTDSKSPDAEIVQSRATGTAPTGAAA